MQRTYAEIDLVIRDVSSARYLLQLSMSIQGLLYMVEKLASMEPGKPRRRTNVVIRIHSEGFGIMDWHRTLGMGQSRDVGVIMLGFRNASVL